MSANIGTEQAIRSPDGWPLLTQAGEARVWHSRGNIKAVELDGHQNIPLDFQFLLHVSVTKIVAVWACQSSRLKPHACVQNDLHVRTSGTEVSHLRHQRVVTADQNE